MGTANQGNDRQSTGFPKEFSDALDKQISQIRDQIEEQAIQIAQKESDPSTREVQVSLSHLTEAIDIVTAASAPSTTRLDRFFAYVPPFTLICFLLCVAFAWLGLSPLAKATSVDPKVAEKLVLTSSGFLDIAKIFAGAIVGSATTATAARIAKRRR